MSEVQVYGFCDAKCKHQVLTIDQTVNLIQEMAANGFQVPNDFIPVTAVNSIVEQNTGKSIRLWFGTQAQWDNWTGDKVDVFAVISDDQTLQSILDRLSALENIVNKKKLLWSGNLVVNINSGNQSLTLTDTFKPKDRIEIVYLLRDVQIYQTLVTGTSASASAKLRFVDYSSANSGLELFEITLSNLNTKTIQVSALKRTPTSADESVCQILEIYKI